MQPWFFLRCQRQQSPALSMLRTYLKKLMLQANSLLCHLCMRSHQTTRSSQMANLKSQRMHAHILNHRLLTKLWESHQLCLLSQLVQAIVDGFAQCHEEWLIPCHCEISTEAKECSQQTWIVQPQLFPRCHPQHSPV
jgi:hypothetical protein